MIGEIAIFPLRAQPPHLGHILTLCKLYGQYDKIILYVTTKIHPYFTEDDFIIPPEEVVAVLRNVFQHMPKIKVMLGLGHLRDYTSFEELPYFDVLVTGNPVSIKKYRKNLEGLKTVRFFPRSIVDGRDVNGTFLRKMMKSIGEKNENE